MSVCLNHPDREAHYRCTACRKPVCEECVILDKENAFCSRECQAGAMLTSEGVEQFQEKQAKEKRLAKIRNAILFLIFIALAAGAAYFFTSTKQGKKLLNTHLKKGPEQPAKQLK